MSHSVHAAGRDFVGWLKSKLTVIELIREFGAYFDSASTDFHETFNADQWVNIMWY